MLCVVWDQGNSGNCSKSGMQSQVGDSLLNVYEVHRRVGFVSRSVRLGRAGEWAGRGEEERHSGDDK